jgi:hypothetical protein
MNIKNKFLVFSEGKTQEKHLVTGVQQIKENQVAIIGDKQEVVEGYTAAAKTLGFFIHTTFKKDHKTIKSRTFLSRKKFDLLVNDGHTTFILLENGKPKGMPIQLVD